MIIDTHAHLDVEDFADDLPEVISRAHEAGVGKIFHQLSTSNQWIQYWLFADSFLTPAIQ